MPSHDFIHTWGWLGVILVWLIWTLLVFGVGWRLAYQLRPPHPKSEHGPLGVAEDPLEVLKLRYARGEITRDEFEQMKRDIGAAD
jgi:putative membrane protein